MANSQHLAWAIGQKIELMHIHPGKPIENAHIESFNGRLREECLRASWFRKLAGPRSSNWARRRSSGTKAPHWERVFAKSFGLLLARTGPRRLRRNLLASSVFPMPGTNSGNGCNRP